MNIIISNSSGKPIYDQITSQVKGMIMNGTLKPGEALPSMRLLAKELRISVITTKRAYEELEREGFVTSQVGIGTFVSAGNLELLRDSKRRLVEQKMFDVIRTAKSLKITKEELQAMMEILYEEDTGGEKYEQ